MSDFVIDDTIEVKKEKLKQPSKQWRNKWWFKKGTIFSDTVISNNIIHWSSYIWPSKEIAEEKALESLEKLYSDNEQNYQYYIADKRVKWKGSFPIE